ncbi:hypothetical protein BJV82DRAFT_665405 [Fennellomyces sp. T-0311]|nr:hypothetical protein BJV82DRAFT_665405 [Fennellomyces sp. T-0311]
MPPSPPPNRSSHGNRHILVERRPPTALRTCEPCRRRKRTTCTGVRPCSHCSESNIECVYGVVSDLPRSVFTTSSARRLSSGSACETCRRRKTKCDGGSPCGFCASAGIECVNNSERRKRAMGIPTSTNTSQSVTHPPDAEAIDRIEDRLRRIEELMTAFTPTTNSPLASGSPRMIRQHRHSVQGISVAKEQAELRTAYALKKKRMSPPPFDIPSSTSSSSSNNNPITRYATPPNSNGSQKRYSPPARHHSPSPPPLSPTLMMRQSSNTQPLTSSMLNLTLSPSSSSSSTSNNSAAPQSSMSTPANNQGHKDARQSHWSTADTMTEWKIASSSMPSLMDQLSKRTFATSSAFNYSNTEYPPYPLSLTPPQSSSSPSPAVE